MTILTIQLIKKSAGALPVSQAVAGAKKNNIQKEAKAADSRTSEVYSGPKEDKGKKLIEKQISRWFASAARRHGAGKNDRSAANPAKEKAAFNKVKATEEFLTLVHRQTIWPNEPLKVGPMTFMNPADISGIIRYEGGFFHYTTGDGHKYAVKTQVSTGDVFLFGPKVGEKQLQRAKFLAQALGYLELPKNPEGYRGFYQPNFRGSAE